MKFSPEIRRVVQSYTGMFPTIVEAAAEIGVGRTTIYSWIREEYEPKLGHFLKMKDFIEKHQTRQK